MGWKNLSPGTGIFTMFDSRKLPIQSTCQVAVIGLGYVGLPLAINIGTPRKSFLNREFLNRKVIGYDINSKRIQELKENLDNTKEVSSNEIIKAKNLEFTDQIQQIIESDVFIVSVPTPIDKAKRPNLDALSLASTKIGECLINRKRSTIPVIVFESTVYPGATEEFCIPIIEKTSERKINLDFVCGYSPERINPCDNIHSLQKIVKVTSGSSNEASDWIDDFYKSFIEAGTFKVENIKTAEAAKVIENTQRDINIALVNELAVICNKIGIDTLNVLEAAETKWNFLPFKPGLVGGHCIGVDPYYLTYKSEQLGYTPQVVLSGRRINDKMGEWIAQEIIKEMSGRGLPLCKTKILILGLTYKENCSDMRNSKIIEMIKFFKSFNISVTIHDPVVDQNDPLIPKEEHIISSLLPEKKYDAVFLALAHKEFLLWDKSKWKSLLKDDSSLIFDLKGVVPIELNPKRI